MTEKFLCENKFISSETTEKVINPYNGHLIGEYSRASEQDFIRSAQYMQQSFNYYKSLPSYIKQELLYTISEKLKEEKSRIAKLITDETGKPIKFSMLEVERAILTFRLGAELISYNSGEVLKLDLLKGSEKKSGIVVSFPYGLVLGITPWNFPLNLVAHKISPSLSSSNVIIIKPASYSALTAIELAKIIYACSETLGLEFIPVNLLTLKGTETDKIIGDNNINIISFTGSSSVGWGIKKKARVNTKVLLELGGNAGVIVNDDADLKLAVSKIIAGGFSQAGQSCISIQRVYIHNRIYDDFRNLLAEECRNIKYGNPYDEEVICGPMINQAEAERAESWIKEAISAGATLLAGGNRDKAVLEPTVIENAPDYTKLKCEEVFAPVITIERFSDYRDAVDKINNSRYGLQAAVFTERLSDIKYAFEYIETGGVIINDASSYRMDSMPYGGVKESGNTREGIKYAFEELTKKKILVI
jgi:glyceraldehyde-3-phosphate dehydrogenase (NADP+)